MDKEFIDDIAINRMTKEESFRKNFPDLCEEQKDIEKLAEKRFNKKLNIEYYNALMEEVRNQENKMTEWTREEATRDLIEVKNALKDDIMKNGNRKQAVLMAYLQAIKELNLMNGYNEVNITSKNESIKIIGFNYLKEVDDNGKIIDVEDNNIKKIEEQKESVENKEQ